MERIYLGNASGQVGIWNHAANWKPVNVRSSGYEWTASGSGTNEYYLELAGGGDPSIPAPGPASVLEDAAAMTPGSAGTLAVGEWDFADNDTLGYSTIYVRLTDEADPDSKAFNFLTYTAVPGAGEDVTIPAGADAIEPYDATGIALGAVRFEEGYQGLVGDEDAYLRINCTGLLFAGEGTAYIDLAASAIAPEVIKTSAANVGYRGLYLLGSALTTLRVMAGDVGLASRAGESSRVDAIEVLPAAGAGATASLWIGDEVVDVAGTGHPDITLGAGATVRSRSEVDALTQLAGDYTQEENIWASAQLYGGTTKPEGTGTYAATVMAGGKIDTSTDSRTKTFTDTTVRKGSTLLDGNSRITYTNAIEFPDGIGSAAGITLDFGRSRKFTPVAI